MATTKTMACPAHNHEEVPNGKDRSHTQHVEHEPIDQSKLAKIPHPSHQYYFGFLGHLPELDRIFPPRTYWNFMDTHGEIMQLDLGMWNYLSEVIPRIFIGNHALMSELMDDKRFIKFTHISPTGIRELLGDGLVTAELSEKNWWKAHRLLAPAFGPLGLRKMFDDMVEISSQMVLKWDRFGPGHEIDLTDDTKRVAIDTIGLCTFGYRFNEFYTQEHHPFVGQLQQALVESARRGGRTPLVNRLFYTRANQLRLENMAKVTELCNKILQDRINHPNPDATDFLNLMLNDVDQESGEKLSIENIQFQIPTFLSIGTEMLSASLSFVLYYLCANPEVQLKAQQAVDQVVGDKVLTADMLPKLTYLDACIKEALRLQPPTAILNRTSVRDTVLGDKYLVKKGQMVSALPRHVHRDRKVWGEDADEFRPERMLKEGRLVLPPNNAWKPVSISHWSHLLSA